MMKITTLFKYLMFLSPFPAVLFLVWLLSFSPTIWDMQILVGIRGLREILAAEYAIRSLVFFCGIFYGTYIFKNWLIDLLYSDIELRIALVVIRIAVVVMFYMNTYYICSRVC